MVGVRVGRQLPKGDLSIRAERIGEGDHMQTFLHTGGHNIILLVLFFCISHLSQTLDLQRPTLAREEDVSNRRSRPGRQLGPVCIVVLLCVSLYIFVC